MKKKFCIMIHYRNPFIYNAGSENYIISQIKHLDSIGVDTLLLFPVIKKGIVTLKGWGVLYGLDFWGIKSVESVKKYIIKMCKNAECGGVFIHSLIGCELTELKKIICIGKPIILYVHDYSSCCKQYNLLKNDENYCGNALLKEEKCNSCRYYNISKKRKKQFRDFFKQIEDFTVIAPSKMSAKLWGDAYPEYRDKIVIILHQKLVDTYYGNNEELSEEDNVKVAFVGNGIKIKGWDIWKNVIDKVLDKKIVLYHFGKANIQYKNVINISVSIQKDGPDAMIKALRNNKIDIAILFSGWPETYSYTYYECLASNCFIITSPLSGNIAYEVENRKNGILIDYNENALKNVLNNSQELKCFINKFRTNSHYSPGYLIPNYDYENYLNFDSVKISFMETSLDLIDLINASICNILYSVRYKHELIEMRKSKL